MKTLDRYIARNVLGAVLVVQTLLLGLDFLLALVNELDNLNETYQITNALYFVTMTLPRRFYDLVPVSVMVGSLIGLGALASSNELSVIRAAGVSIVRIIVSVMKPMMLLMALTFVVGEFIAPQTEVTGQNYRILKRSGNTMVKSESGVWHRDGNEYFYFSSIQANGQLFGVSRYEFNEENQELKSIAYAEYGVYQDDHWLLKGVQVSEVNDDGVFTGRTPEWVWKTDLTPDLIKMIIITPRYLAPSELWQYGQYLKERGLKSHEHMLAFWQKMLMPLTLSSLVLVAASFVFGPLRSAPAGTRVFSGVVVGLLVKYLQDILGPASVVYGFEPVWAILLPALGCALYGAILIRRSG
ncbi:LPS export ABC transporter permease LptG [Oceanospirillum sediminis]|uniref:LPS export ABC transporter permease LptG n=1 Tax=Oceanospirillum sediminis TaxID=2760088 RepID=A0A839IJ33_9GAMM|nr:LPS export ABC transporter permease LptG [Oceanospirillum sediminis]MBB1485185.1 LPS export ABC transporter permease LptG [Oceanospirillum sediminis]